MRDLLSLVPGLMFEEEEEKEEEPEVVITPQAIVDAQMKAIFEQPVTTRRKSKRRGGF